MDLYWRDSLVCPTEEEYTEMVIHKTGGLFRLAVELMQIRSKVTTYAFLQPPQHYKTDISSQRLFKIDLFAGSHLPNPRRLPKPAKWTLRREERIDGSSDRGQVLVPHHPQCPQRSKKHTTPEYTQTAKRGYNYQNVCRAIYGVDRKLSALP